VTIIIIIREIQKGVSLASTRQVTSFCCHSTATYCTAALLSVYCKTHIWNRQDTGVPMSGLQLHLLTSLSQMFASCLPVIYRMLASCLPVIYRMFASRFPVAYQMFASCLPVACQLFASCLPVVCQMFSSCLPVVCQMFVGCLPVAYQLFARCLTVTFQKLNGWNHFYYSLCSLILIFISHLLASPIDDNIVPSLLHT
jgi:hypothetical protein